MPFNYLKGGESKKKGKNQLGVKNEVDVLVFSADGVTEDHPGARG